jgi:hypothetical protein
MQLHINTRQVLCFHGPDTPHTISTPSWLHLAPCRVLSISPCPGLHLPHIHCLFSVHDCPGFVRPQLCHDLSSGFCTRCCFLQTIISFDSQETTLITLRPPPGGYVENGPGEAVFSPHNSQRILACPEYEELVLNMLVRFRRDNFIDASEHRAEDIVFTEKDPEGNPVVGFHSDLPVVVLSTQLHPYICPDGVEQPATSFSIIPRMRSILNSASLTMRGNQSRRGQPDTTAMTYHMYPACDECARLSLTGTLNK